MAIYYVSTTGDDSRTALEAQNPSTPKLTIQAAMPYLTLPGDRLRIRGGTYYGPSNKIDTQIVPIASGAGWANPITIEAYPGETVELFEYASSPAFYNVSYVVVDRIISNGGSLSDFTVGANFNTSCHHVRIQRSELKNTSGLHGGQGILHFGNYNEVVNCVIHAIGLDMAVHNAGLGGQNGFYVAGNNNLIDGCELYDIGTNPITIYNGAFINASNNIVRNCFLHPGQARPVVGRAIAVATGHDNLVYNNIVRAGSIDASFSFDAKIYNNTIYDYHDYYALYTSQYATRATFANNLLCLTLGESDDPAAVDSIFTHNPQVDPSAFVDAPNNDFRLAIGSAAIDVGMVVDHVTTDIRGVPRPQGAGFDVGAYEGAEDLPPGPGPGSPLPFPGSPISPGSPVPGVGSPAPEPPPEFPPTLPPVTTPPVPSGTILTETYSDQDMLCPGAWENGYKDGVIESWGETERLLSHPRTGDVVGSSFTFRLSDTDRRIREDLASLTRRYFAQPFQVKMTDNPTRDALGVPWTVFVGNVTKILFEHPLHTDFQLGDLLTSLLLSDQNQCPWRIIGEGFLDQLSLVSESLDRQQPEPIIYGRHIRTIVDAPSAEGFCIDPPYLGQYTKSGHAYHVWLVCGHAVAAIPTIRVDDVEKIADEGTQWFVPHHAGHAALFDGNPYNDFRSSAYGNDRRYTLIFGKVTDLGSISPTDPDACALGLKTLTVAIYGTETQGDGGGEEIRDRLDAYAHFAINYLAHHGIDSYQSGHYLTNPDQALFDETVPLVDEVSFDRAKAIAKLRLPAVGSPADPAGYLVAAVIGAKPGDRSSIRRYVADWNRSCAVRSGWTHLGQYRVCMLHPTTAVKASARLITDATEILEGGFATETLDELHATRIPFRTDYKHSTGVWFTVGIWLADNAAVNYNREIPAEPLEFPFAPGITASYHLARMEGLASQDPPRVIRLQETIGPQGNNDSLAYLELGDYARVQCFDAVSNSPTEQRLHWVIGAGIDVQNRIAKVTLLDVEDLIGFDGTPAPDVGGSPAARNETCTQAIQIGPLTPDFALQLDTAEHATDYSVSGSPSFGGSGVAYHAAWFKLTGNLLDGTLLVTSLGSDYDTQIAVFTGSCGALELVAFNDNYAGGFTSRLELAITGGVDYYILVAGYTALDGGDLHFYAAFEPL